MSEPIPPPHLAAAIAKVMEALRPLSEEQQRRVMRSAAVLFAVESALPPVSAPSAATEKRIAQMCRAVERDESNFGVLSTGEKIAVALVLDRRDLCEFWGSMLECVERLGPEWHAAAFRVQRNGWREEPRS